MPGKTRQRGYPYGGIRTAIRRPWRCTARSRRRCPINTFLFHGSCVAVDGEGYLFAAKSGVGKSTHARLWRELLGDRAVMFSDDEPLIRVTDAVLTTEAMVVDIPEPPAPAPAQGGDMGGMY